MRHEILMNLHRVSGLYDLMQPSYDQIIVFNILVQNVFHFPGPKSDFDGFYTVFGGPGNSQPDSADSPETVSAPPEQTLGSPRRGAGWW